jgi:glycosyltransferase involved in cell wall biosynthesis
MAEISVVIPVYNKEEYLPACLQSVLGRASRDVEAILVDDGSTETCAKLCDTLAAADSRVKVLHQKNGGPAKARNAGIRAATGRYLMFVDSDDMLEEGAIAGIIDAAKEGEPDVIIGNINYVNERKDRDNRRDAITAADLGSNAGPEEVTAYFLKKGIFWPNVRFIINREFYISKELWFFEEVRSQEDIDLVPRVVSAARSFGLIEKSFYRYIMRENSVSSASGFVKYLDLMRICVRLCAAAGQYTGIRKEYLMKGAGFSLFITAEKYASFSAAEKTVFKEWFAATPQAGQAARSKKAARLLMKFFGEWNGLLAYVFLAGIKNKIYGLLNI